MDSSSHVNMDGGLGYEGMTDANRKYQEDFANAQRYLQTHIDNAKASVSESVDELRERLESMKKLMGQRQALGLDNSQLFQGQASSLKGAGIITGNFLSFVFGSALCVIVSVSIYAFYNLYHAVLKRFPSRHTEL